ncbi:MAG: hypothetical protein IPQ12_02525 [Polaromonas sp.]|nr:hypothetical protein [Polaromonas sp.]
MNRQVILKWVSTAVLASVGISSQAQIRANGPDWSLIISGPQIVVPPPPPVHVAPVRPAPAPVAVTPVPGQRPNHDWERDRGQWERERGEWERRMQDRENYWLERERAYVAREKAMLEREKQRLENNRRAYVAINDRQEQQLDKIVDGVNNNNISKNEFTDLMVQQKQISNQERAYLADGFLSQDEYQHLNTLLDYADHAIRFATRGEPPRRDPRFYKSR